MSSCYRQIPKRLLVVCTLALAFIPFLVSGAEAAQVNLAWDPSPSPGVVGYILFYGTSSGNYPSQVDVGDTTTGVVSGLTEGQTYYFAAKAYDTDGIQSVFSEEIAYTLPVANADTDGDGIMDSDETDVYGTDPVQADTDDDGIDDGDEVAYWDADWNADDDGDGQINLLDPDSDNDGFSDGAEYDRGTDPADPNSKPDLEMIWLEAENGSLHSPMEAAEDADTSAGGYIVVPNGNGDVWDSSQVAGDAVYTFQVAAAGDYVIWGRVLAVSGGDDSFFIAVDDGGYALWDAQQADTWVWDLVNDRNGSDPVIYHLDAGEHTLVVKQREDGTKIDRILITSDRQYVPEGFGAETAMGPTMETGEVSVNHKWLPVDLTQSFVDPIVIAKGISCTDADPAVIRIRNVSPTGFEIRVQEWNYLDGAHAAEKIGYLVMEAGSHTLPGGIRVEAGKFSTAKTGSFAAFAFQQAFNQTPVALLSTNSCNGGQAVTTRLKAITTTGFSMCMQEQEAYVQRHNVEEIAYVAWEPSAGSFSNLVFEIGQTDDVVTHKFARIPFYETFLSLPVVITDMQTTDGINTANLRWQNKGIDGVEVNVAEEQSLDPEINHTTEVVGYMVFSPRN
ncbi:MAG: hypothetical protein JSW39_28710 [Desulfobacterales bacterium]|nr:MAG: hypothetical protein JSW39_28710 [Desulfobacterales bacterium]